MPRVLIIDTSVLCVYLRVPGKETCGSSRDIWDKKRIDSVLKRETARSTTLVLPLAAIIETGYHIAQASSRRYETARALSKLMVAVADDDTPWAAFEGQSAFWSAEGLKSLATAWPEHAKKGISIADTSILMIAKFYARRGFDVEILTGDEGLKQYQPPPPVPRRIR